MSTGRFRAMRVLLLRIAFAFLGIAPVMSGAQSPQAPCAPGDKPCFLAAMLKHPARQQAFWEPALAKPVEARIGAAPPELVEFILFDNLSNGYPNRPRVPKLDPAFLADVRRAYEGIPEAVKRKLGPKLAGIYFVEDLGGTGFADAVRGADGVDSVGFIVLDPAVLMKHSANGWSTWKDGTPFRPDPRWKLESRIATGNRDDRPGAIQYILLHEIAHVLSIGAGVHPSWAIPPAEVKSTEAFAFFNQSWTISQGKYASLFDATFPERRNVAYYFGAKLDGADMVKTYEGLEKTNLATLYAATHPGDDFAEAFVNYVHVVMMGKPFEVRISRDAQVVKTYRACWAEKRCAQKRAYLENFLR